MLFEAQVSDLTPNWLLLFLMVTTISTLLIFLSLPRKRMRGMYPPSGSYFVSFGSSSSTALTITKCWLNSSAAVDAANLGLKAVKVFITYLSLLVYQLISFWRQISVLLQNDFHKISRNICTYKKCKSKHKAYHLCKNIGKQNFLWNLIRIIINNVQGTFHGHERCITYIYISF